MAVELLSLAHDRNCEQELAEYLEEELSHKRLPDMAELRARFAPDPDGLPDIEVCLSPLQSYQAVLPSSGEGVGA